MLCSFVLAGALAQSSMLLQSKFDISQPIRVIAEQSKRRGVRRYLSDLPEWDDGDDSNGVQFKLKWKRVRMRVPLPSI